MPSKNEEKIYVENGYYHLYNRGVEKRIIFLDQQDYSVFLSYLKTYLSSKNQDKLTKQLATTTDLKEKDKILKQLRLNNFHNSLKLIAYTLMPNHFHLLIRQTDANTINKFMNSLITRYSMYFNKKYKRIGPLFQGTYKAVLVETEEQLLYLTYYIHHQGIFFKREYLSEPRPSSYSNYLGKISQKWIKPEEILSFFSKSQKTPLSYKAFVEGFKEEDTEIISDLILD